jgi:serine/threonine-protein kinase RsbW
MTQTLVATPQAVGVARRAACDFARRHGASDRRAADVALAVSEACTNAVRHSGSADLVLDLHHHDHELRVRVVDRGSGVHAGVDPGAGLGLPIISRVASHVEVREPACGGTDVAMTFALA